MKFHRIDLQGPIYIEEVSGLPTFSASQERRLLYDTVNNRFYVANNNEWAGFGLVYENDYRESDVTYTYNINGRVTKAQYDVVDGTWLVNYTYNNKDQITQITKSLNGTVKQTITYTYDNSDKISSTTIT